MATATTTATQVITGKVRFSFVHVFKPKAVNDGQEAKYSAALWIPKSDKETMRKIRAAIEAARLGSANKFNGKVPDKLKTTLSDGDEMITNDETGETERKHPPECAGHYILNTSSKTKPGIIGRDRQEILDPTEFYSGCYGRAALNFYAYNVGGSKGIACGLNHVQKLADGEPLGGGGGRAEDTFPDDLDDDDFLD